MYYPDVHCFGAEDLIRDVTVALVYRRKWKSKGLWLPCGKAVSSDPLHAEEWLIGYMKKLNTAIKKLDQVRLEITKSPCYRGENDHNCAEQLGRLLKKKRLSALHVRYLGIYNSGSHEGAFQAQCGIGELVGYGADVEVWDWRNDPATPDKVRNWLARFCDKLDAGTLPPARYTDPRTRGEYARSPETPGYRRFAQEFLSG